MSRSKQNSDGWDMIFDTLIIDSEPPPTKYINDATIITKSGNKFKVSAEDFTAMVQQHKESGFEHTEIYSCSISINFTRIKRDVNRWTNKFIADIEADIAKTLAETPKKRKPRASRNTSSKID
jgi:hypothetical protein